MITPLSAALEAREGTDVRNVQLIPRDYIS